MKNKKLVTCKNSQNTKIPCKKRTQEKKQIIENITVQMPPPEQ